MAFRCGFGVDGGFVDACAVPPPAGGCGGGYGTAPYATVEYAGGSPCISGGSPPGPTTNLENVCIQTCGSTPI